MVKIWQKDELEQDDPRLPHFNFPPKYLTPERLKKRTGVFLWKIGLDDGVAAGNKEQSAVQMEWINREYKFVMDDIWEVKESSTPRFMEKIKQDWFLPHAHTLEESRLVLEGQAYYDVEDPKTEKWIRIFLERGDFIVIPAGCLHRFTPDTTNYVKVKRFFQTKDGEPLPVSKTVAQVHDCRVDYVERINAGTFDNSNGPPKRRSSSEAK